MTFNLAKPNRPLHVGVILTKGTTEMLDVAPVELFTWMDKKSLQFLNFPPEMIEDGIEVVMHWINEDKEPAAMKGGAKIVPTDSFQTAPQLDIVLMGAHGAYQTNEAEKEFIRKAFEDCSAFITICGGIYPLLEAGVLQGKTVAAPRLLLEMSKGMAPDVDWVDRRWVRDGKVWSSSTLLNGADLMRAFAEENWGRRSGMIEALLDTLHFPQREVDFKDFNGHNISLGPACSFV
ncbi:hypothetical protein BB8028_0007g06640 [Beauveria bassiana]|uniref:DJ-1/PfpI domain-containing protein n=2 Tax=Beauveria bassiana TaxID=176275 RepID=A0A0A2V7W0_BEABA|nr:Isonitrile hydratase [Beauveria bassiana]KGQ03966.1 hypothetical protein BBAD15_g10811 [Beauveria bassiana D1-5]PQK17469.1 hypothetical protein BB8028_0007g06640 [Beauveria bassiana]